MSFQADELFGPTTAGEEWVRQHGRSTDAEVVSLGWTLIEDANEGAEFGGTIGALGDALERGDVGRGVVANADGADPLVPGEPIHREAALTLADSSGATACGEVGPTILTVDDTAPFGVRLDQVAVMEAFDRCSTPDSVVMVEASDLRRALAFRPRATPELAESARAQALASTDALAGAILERLDPERDAVVVVAADDAADPWPRGARHPRVGVRAGVPHLGQHPARRLRAPHGPDPDDREPRGRGARRGEHGRTCGRATRWSRHRGRPSGRAGRRGGRRPLPRPRPGPRGHDRGHLGRVARARRRRRAHQRLGRGCDRGSPEWPSCCSPSPR